MAETTADELRESAERLVAYQQSGSEDYQWGWSNAAGTGKRRKGNDPPVLSSPSGSRPRRG